jgi:hypothetical protein
MPIGRITIIMNAHFGGIGAWRLKAINSEAETTAKEPKA